MRTRGAYAIASLLGVLAAVLALGFLAGGCGFTHASVNATIPQELLNPQPPVQQASPAPSPLMQTTAQVKPGAMCPLPLAPLTFAASYWSNKQQTWTTNYNPATHQVEFAVKADTATGWGAGDISQIVTASGATAGEAAGVAIRAMAKPVAPVP